MPLISVIVPVYKVENYINRCVDSILGQSFADFELILVDDGSPDSCPAVCDMYAQNDKRVRVLHKENQGVSKARNDGVNASKGEYITFIDSDDSVHKEYLGTLYEAIVKTGAELSIVGRYVPDAEGSLEVLSYSGRQAIERLCKLNDSRFRAPWGKLVKKSILEKIPFPTDRSYAEDMAVVYRWYNEAEKVAEVERGLYYYTINDEGATYKPYGLHRLGNLKTLNEMLSFFSQNSFDELYITKLNEYLYQLYWQYGELCKTGRKDIACKLKKELKQRLKTEDRIQIETHKEYYNFIYPKRMWIYWSMKGICEKVKQGLVHK